MLVLGTLKNAITPVSQALYAPLNFPGPLFRARLCWKEVKLFLLSKSAASFNVENQGLLARVPPLLFLVLFEAECDEPDSLPQTQ